jgi:hypothetical protein
VKIVTSLIKQEKALLKPIAPMLEVFSQLFRDGRQSQLAFLLLFNSFLIFGSAPIRNQVIELLSQGLMALHLHSQDNPTSARDKIAIAAIYLLLQNTLAVIQPLCRPTAMNSPTNSSTPCETLPYTLSPHPTTLKTEFSR